jgi:hypothetical protein
MSIGDLWYKNAIIYCLDVENCQDANGDGIGVGPGGHRHHRHGRADADCRRARRAKRKRCAARSRQEPGRMPEKDPAEKLIEAVRKSRRP